jgi:hypothetical protein
LLVYLDSPHWYVSDSSFPSLGFRPDFDRFFFDQILLMSMTRRSLDSRSLARELVVHMPSHLPGHLLQPPWREVRVALLGRLPHSSFLLLLRVILFHRLAFSYLGILVLALIRVHFISFFFTSQLTRCRPRRYPGMTSWLTRRRQRTSYLQGSALTLPSQVYMHPLVLRLLVYACVTS